ncbi:MAG: hypothetical protein ACI9YE_003665 [Psychroserpens sp.]
MVPLRADIQNKKGGPLLARLFAVWLSLLT